MNDAEDIWEHKTPTRNQHYIPRYYLWAWSNDGGKHVVRKMKGGLSESRKIEHAGNSECAYSLPDLTLDDIKQVDGISKSLSLDVCSRKVFFSSIFYSMIARKIIRETPDAEACVRYVLGAKMMAPDAEVKVLELAEFIKGGNKLPAGFLLEEDRRVIEGYERLMTLVENDAKAALKGLREQGVSALHSDIRDVRIANYMFKMLFRTERYFPRLEIRNPESNVFYYVAFLIADAVGKWFVANGPSTFTLIDNHTPFRFLTGDQPVVNLCEDGSFYDLYFPISPHRALVLMLKGRFEKAYSWLGEVDHTSVSRLNAAIYANSHSELYAYQPGDFGDPDCTAELP